MAGATPVVRVPIDITQPEGGYVEFRGDITAPAGVYSFTYYFRKAAVKPKEYNSKDMNAHNHPWAIYITGLELYTAAVRAGAPSAEWKVVIYTDQQTLDDIDESMPEPEKGRIKAVFEDPNVILAKVVWPEYAPFPADAPAANKERKVENAILRTFRMFSFAAFTCPVFVRDADTTFDVGQTPREGELETIQRWETVFYEQARAKGVPMIYASQVGYVRGFHVNYRAPDTSQSLGAFAGMVSYLGGIPEMRDLWQESLAYIRGTCKIIPETGVSDNVHSIARYISKDEQILLFVFLPPLIDRTFFFYYNFVIGGDVSYWADQKNPFGRAFNRIREAFPEEFVKKRSMSLYGSQNYWSTKNPQFFLSPDQKLRDYLWKTDPQKYLEREALKRKPVEPGTPPPSMGPFGAPYVPPPINVSGIEPKSREELAREWMEEWVGKGITDPSDPIVDPRWAEEGGDPLHNSYSVIEAFRNPKYDLILRIAFEELQRAHRKICMLKGLPGRFALAAKFNEANRVNREKEEAAAAARAAARAAAPWPQGAAAGAPAPRPLGFGAPQPLPLGLGLGLGLGAADPTSKTGGRRKKTRRSKKKGKRGSRKS